MRRLLLISVLVAGLALVLVGTASADNGPHQGRYAKNTDFCAGCHRAHRGLADFLLKEASQTLLCFSCHGSSATGADTNVYDGEYADDDATPGEGEGVVGNGLRAGGFINVTMDPDPSDGPAIPQSYVVTARHNVIRGISGQPDDPVGTMWGNGAISATADPGKPNITLNCGSCHNPHGFDPGDRYRILKPIPSDSGAATPVDVNDETAKKYTVEYYTQPAWPAEIEGYRNIMDATWLNDGRDVSYSQWCSQCHTRYLAADFTDSGDAIFKHRHATNYASGGITANILTCPTCHVAHGTAALMTGAYSGNVELPDGTVPADVNDSRLLHVDNRGVCVQCHPVPGGANQGCLTCHPPAP